MMQCAGKQAGSNLYPWQSSRLKTIVENNAFFLLSQKSKASNDG
jgi:hypothetical protein